MAERAAVKWLGLLGWIVLTFLAAAIGSQFMPGAWYASLAKPSWNPPGWVFGPVWTVLYLLMAIAAWLVWRAAGLTGARLALACYLLQLVLNAAWSWLFFGRQSISGALADIIALWALILLTMVLFRRHSATAAALLVPYLLWVSFATALNFALFRLNGPGFTSKLWPVP